MIAGAEASQLHLFSILDLLCVTVAPLYRNVRVRISINEYVEGAVPV
jgi:hypothetical protein